MLVVGKYHTQGNHSAKRTILGLIWCVITGKRSHVKKVCQKPKGLYTESSNWSALCDTIHKSLSIFSAITVEESNNCQRQHRSIISKNRLLRRASLPNKVVKFTQNNPLRYHTSFGMRNRSVNPSLNQLRIAVIYWKH